MDKIMAFDVMQEKDDAIPDRFKASAKHPKSLMRTPAPVDRIRRLALIEGRDQYHRLLVSFSCPVWFCAFSRMG
jgi:hypothetical protein